MMGNILMWQKLPLIILTVVLKLEQLYAKGQE